MNFILYGGIAYLIALLFLKKYLRVTFYYGIFLLISYSIIYVLVLLNLEEIGKHAAHGAPLFMMLYAAYITSLLISVIFIIIDLVFNYTGHNNKK